LGFRIGQSSGECDVAISLYPADWPFAICKVLADEHLFSPDIQKFFLQATAEVVYWRRALIKWIKSS
jgi:hypothetical protein